MSAGAMPMPWSLTVTCAPPDSSRSNTSSLALTAVGLVWQAIASPGMHGGHALAGVNVWRFAIELERAIGARGVRPELLIELGLLGMILTPYARVVASLLYFAFAARNWKYTAFTGFVLTVLTYSLFLR